MPRQKETAAVIRAKGKSHLSKEELANREKREIKVNLPDVVAPKYLTTKIQRDQFYELASKLKTVGEFFFTELDADTLARYILAREQYNRCNKKLRSLTIKGEFGTKEFGSALRAQDKAFAQARALGNDLGLTVSSRCKIEVPQTKKEQPENRFAKFQK